MKLTITQVIRDVLARIGHVPDDLRARFDAIAPADGGTFTLTLSDDDATALAELAQWHLKTDPATGRPTTETAPFADLIRLIDDAQL
jgi:hypothetical protein